MSEPASPRLLKALLSHELHALLAKIQEIDHLAPGEAAELSAALADYNVRLLIARQSSPATLPMPAVAAASPATAGPRTLPPDAPRLYRQLLAKATDKPQTARALIRAAGYEYHGTSRAGITWLVRNGFLVMAGNNAYRLPPNANGESWGRAE